MSGGVPAVLEPVGVCRDDGNRPDGMSLILGFISPLELILAPSNVSTSSGGASWLANSAEIAKLRKYSTLTASFYFSPLCVETLGAWGSCAHSLVWQIGGADWRQ